MPRVLAIRSNPLLYPGGHSPGIDNSHVALSGGRLQFSGVSQGSNFTDLSTGKIGTVAGAPTAKINGKLGPVADFGAVNGPGLSFTGKSTAAQSQLTFAMLINGNSWGGGARILFSTAFSSGNGFSLYLPTAATLNIGRGAGLATLVSSGITLTTGIPYFLVASFNASTSNFLVLNLNTGAVQTASSTGLASDTNTGGIGVSNDNFGSTSRAGIAAAAITTSFLSLQQMQQFAADPWSFWYPRKFDLTTLLKGASGGQILTMTAAQGIYSVAGIAATPNSARALAAAQGSYALSGKAATLNRGIKISAAPGSYTINGIAASLPRGRTITAAQGTFTVNGSAASLPRGRMIVAASGTFTINGVSATFPVALSIKPVTGVYSIGGRAVVLTYSPAGGGGASHSNPFFASPGRMTTLP